MLRLDDGAVIDITGRPAQGSRHTVLFGRDRHSGSEFVVKIELIDDAPLDHALLAIGGGLILVESDEGAVAGLLAFADFRAQWQRG